jgi:hypothetical protein
MSSGHITACFTTFQRCNKKRPLRKLKHKNIVVISCALSNNFFESIELKKMDRSYGVKPFLEQIQTTHNGLGYIFVPVLSPYMPGRNPKLYKLAGELANGY